MTRPLARDAATRAHVLGRVQHAREREQRPDRQHQRRRLSGSSRAAAAGWAPTPPSSVCDSYGRTHDHENLFVVGAPTTPTGGCTNGTLTFVALTLAVRNRDFSDRSPGILSSG